MHYNKTGFDDETQLFNREIKESFMSQYEGNTLAMVKGTFVLLAKAEEGFDKDLFEMNEEEFAETLRIFKCKTLKSMVTRFSVLNAYAEWCYPGYTNGRPPITSFPAFTQDKLTRYLNKADMFISYEDLLETFKPYAEIEDPIEREKLHHPKNYQDLAPMLALWDGVKGKALSELTFLRKSDLHEDTLLVDCRDENDKVVRSVKVQPETMKYLILASKESEYVTNRKYKDKEGDAPSSGTRYVTYELPYNDFVFKQQILKGEERSRTADDPMRSSAIIRRITALTSKIRPHLMAQTIHQSGMMYKLLEIEDKQGLLTTEDYKRIVMDYGIAEDAYFAYKQLYLINFNQESVDKIGK
jgi:hypothetical protein